MSIGPSLGLQENWVDVSFTPVDRLRVTLARVSGVDIEDGGRLVEFEGDGDVRPTVVAAVHSDTKVIVSSADVGTLLSLPVGTRGYFQGTWQDASGSVGGSIAYTVVNCVVQSNSSSTPRAKFGDGRLVLVASSPDGRTSPVTSVRV